METKEIHSLTIIAFEDNMGFRKSSSTLLSDINGVLREDQDLNFSFFHLEKDINNRKGKKYNYH
ncbi:MULTISPECIES: hypothetical protein [unclassified Flavobacterium]|uniref:hypothetical protein n=1 Tax=unclassified Flavobacterium TaxID=196869 RepID=UPI001047A3D8|nr:MULTISPECIES: hypothetical protein [unclassified Flavobacterium]